MHFSFLFMLFPTQILSVTKQQPLGNVVDPDSEVADKK
jgi:hypothetical protein